LVNIETRFQAHLLEKERSIASMRGMKPVLGYMTILEPRWVHQFVVNPEVGPDVL